MTISRTPSIHTTTSSSRRWLAVALVGLSPYASGCGAAQAPEERGDAFCESYENNFTGTCRQNCEATTEGKAEAVGAQCEKQCDADLANDDTYVESCVNGA